MECSSTQKCAQEFEEEEMKYNKYIQIYVSYVDIKYVSLHFTQPVVHVELYVDQCFNQLVGNTNIVHFVITTSTLTSALVGLLGNQLMLQ